MKKKSQLVKWFRSMLLVLIPMLLVCTLLCVFILNSYETSIIHNNTSLTQSSRNIVDERFRECVYLANYLTLSQENTSISHLTQLPETTPTEAYQLSMDINELVVGNEALSGAFIYYPKIDLVVGNLGCYCSSSYYVLRNFPHRDNYDLWLSSLLGSNGNQLVNLPLSVGTQLCYIRTYQSQHEPVAVIVLELDHSQISALISSSIYPADSASVLLVNGTPALTAGESELLSDDILLRFQNGDSIEQIQGRLCFFSVSEVLPNVSFLHVYSNSGLMRSLRSVITVCICVLAVCFVGSIILSVFFSRKNVAPIDRIVRQFNGQNIPEGQDELTFISNQIDRMMVQQYQNEQQMNDYQLHLDDLFTGSLLHGQYQSEAEIMDLAVHYGINFNYPVYQVIALRIQQKDEVFSVSYSRNIRQLSIPGVDFYVSRRKNTLAVLVNSEDSISDSEMQKLCFTIFDCVFSETVIWAGVGFNCDSALDIPACFHCAIAALEDALHEASKTVVICSNPPSRVPNSLSDDKLLTPDNRKNKLAEEAKKIVDEHFTDSLLGVYYVAEQLGISNSYLSTIYKNVYGISMLQYISQLRINYAKELLLNTNSSIKDIALKVGYSSDISFIRAFRRMENCTPSNIRNSALQ